MDKLDLKKIANPREQVLAGLVILAMFIMFFRVIYFPTRLQTEQLRGQIHNLKMEKDALEKFTQALLKVKPSFSEKTESEILNTKIKILKGEVQPVVQNTAALLAIVTAKPFSKGIGVKGMSDLPPTKQDGYQKASFFINAQGSFNHVVQYLEKIEHLPALISLDHLTLKTIDPKVAQVDLELNGSLFQWEEKHAETKP